MSYVMKEHLANKANYGSKRDLSKIKYLVIHYTSNDGDSDEANGKYFANNVVKASSHYFVDDNSVTQSVPDDYVAYAVGGKCQSNHHPMYKVITNTNSISIEMCDNHKDGTVHICDETLANTYALARALMSKYNITIDRVYRHYDVNGKLCPNCNGLLDDAIWQNFKNNIVNSTVGNLGTSTATTVPLTLECTGALINPAASPIFCPTFTVSPTSTIGLAGAPRCWDMEITTVFGSGNFFRSICSLNSLCSDG